MANPPYPYDNTVQLDLTAGTWMSLDVSPDGKEIVWHKVSSKVNQLFVMDAHGAHLPKLTNFPADANPSRADWGTAVA